MLLMRGLSVLADSAILLPVAGVTLCLLALRRQWAGAGALLVGLVSGAGATLAAKLLFNACGASLTSLDLISPSGHASLAAIVYGALAILVAAGWAPGPRRLAVAGAVALVAGIGASRVALGYHSWPEVVFGWALGGGAALLFAALHARAGRPALPVASLVGVALVGAALIAGGQRFTPEDYVAGLARRAASVLDVCRDDPAEHRALRARRREGP